MVVSYDGPASEVAAAYLSPQKSSFTGVYSLLETTARPPEFPPQIAAAAILDKETLEPVSAVLPLQVLQMDVELRPLTPMRTPMIYIGFSDSRGERVFAVGSYFSATPLGRADGPIVASVTFTMPPLYPGRYDFEIGLMPHSGRFVDHVAPAGGVRILHGDLLQTSYPYFAEMRRACPKRVGDQAGAPHSKQRGRIGSSERSITRPSRLCIGCSSSNARFSARGPFACPLAVLPRFGSSVDHQFVASSVMGVAGLRGDDVPRTRPVPFRDQAQSVSNHPFEVPVAFCR